jgi:hypothetical protein
MKPNNVDFTGSPRFPKVDPCPSFPENSIGGAPSGAAPANATDASLFDASSPVGWAGMALRRVSDGAFILTAGRSSNGQNLHQTMTWDSATIEAAISGDSANETYTLDFIDDKSGGWGWVGADNVSISTIPEASSVMLLGLGGAALMLRRRKKDRS